MATYMCSNCREPVEPDDGLWYHAGNMSMMCDGDDSTDLTRQAEPADVHVAYYTSADVPGGFEVPWSVYRELYAGDAWPDGEPIDGSQVHASTWPNYDAAELEARRLSALEVTS